MSKTNTRPTLTPTLTLFDFRSSTGALIGTRYTDRSTADKVADRLADEYGGPVEMRWKGGTKTVFPTDQHSAAHGRLEIH